MLTYCYIIIIILLRCVPRVYKISTGVNFYQNIVTETPVEGRQYISIYFVFLYLFASIILVCFIYANFLFHCHYYCITIFPPHVLTEVYTTPQHSSSNNSRGWVQYIYRLCILRFFRLCFFVYFIIL